MPELPEVETIVRGLRASLPGRRILSVRLEKTDFIDDPVALAVSLPGAQIENVERIGKFICLELTHGVSLPSPEAPVHLYVHLGMTGQLTLFERNSRNAPHTHVFLTLDNGQELRYTDIRRFGRIVLVEEPQIAGFRDRLGSEPLEITFKEFRERLGGRRARIKALLLNQHVLCGLGNIYADESLFRARLHPARLASELTKSQMAGLYRAVKETLTAAIQMRGSSISDYVDSAGKRGEFQRRHRVYRRVGRPCVRCGTIIRRITVAGRSSSFCPRCQPAPRGTKSL